MHCKLRVGTNILRLSIKMPPKAVARVLRVHARPHRRRGVQRQLDAVLEHVEVPAVLAVVVRLRMAMTEDNDNPRSLGYDECGT